MTQGELARRVGFNHQSAIGNLETRNSTRGGFKIMQIAEALEVPVEWLMSGPDGPSVPYSQPRNELEVREPSPTYPSANLGIAIELLRSLKPDQLLEAITYLEFLKGRRQRRSNNSAGSTVPAPTKRAA